MWVTIIGMSLDVHFGCYDFFHSCFNNNRFQSSLSRLHGLGISFSDTCVIYIYSEIDFQIRL